MLAAMRRDLDSVRERDPAARSLLEIAFCYSGVHAVWGHRVSHWLWQQDLKFAARAFCGLARWLTGVEIHPAAVLGARDDAIAMQFLIPGWRFDDKRPSLVR